MSSQRRFAPIGGRFEPEQVAGLNRNHWPLSTGIYIRPSIHENFLVAVIFSPGLVWLPFRSALRIADKHLKRIPSKGWAEIIRKVYEDFLSRHIEAGRFIFRSGNSPRGRIRKSMESRDELPTRR